MFSLRLFGGPSLQGELGMLDGRAVRGHRLALLALLALTDGQPVTRDKLIALLWPESDAERARHLLSQSLYLLRQATADDVVVGAGDGLRLNPDRIRSDVQEFTTALDRGDHERAVALYQGPFLDGFFLAGSPEFEQWAHAERDALARRQAQALEALGDAAGAQGDVTAAVAWWQALAAHDPYCSRTALRLVEALAVAGQRAAAIRHAGVHAALLRDELGIEPPAELMMLAERLRACASPNAAAGIVTPAAPGTTAASDIEGAPVGETPVHGASAARARASAGGVAAPPLQPEAPAPAARSRMRRVMRWGAAIASILFVTGAAFAARQHAGRPAPLPSLAVLPFADLGADPDGVYFAEGIHDDLLASLSRIASIRVISRTSVLPYRGLDKDLRQVGRDLRVSHVLEGSVRRDNGRLLVTVQLVDARTQHQLWSEQYHRELVDVLAVQADIAQRVTAALQVKLTTGELRRIGSPPTRTLSAYDLYLQAMAYARRYRADDAAIAAGLLQRAIAADPMFALAHARLASTYAIRAELFGAGREWLDSAFVVAQHAVSLDPELAEAHHALGTTLLARGAAGEARSAFERAVALNPSFAGAAGNLGALFGRAGEHDRSVMWYRRAAELDPRAAMVHVSLAWNYAILGLPRDAEQALETAFTLQPDLPVAARQHAVLIALLQGDYVRAIRESDLLVAAHPDDPLAWAVAGNARFLAGDAAARKHLERARDLSPDAAWIAPVRVLLGKVYIADGEPERGRALLHEYVADARAVLARAAAATGTLNYGLAAAHAALGESRAALRWLDALVENGAGSYRFRLHDPLLEPLQAEPEFERIRAAANLRLDGMRRTVERELR